LTALLQVEGLSKTFGATKAVSDMSFKIEEGHCVALLGPNGAGKTTTIRMITGLLAPTTGTMSFMGVSDSRGGAQRSMLGYLPQSPAFYNWMTGLEYVTYAAKLCGITGAAAKTLSMEIIERVGLANAAKRRIGGYSGGMKQRLGLAQALVHRPKLLVMDEPVSALDPLGRREVLELLRELKKETTVLFSTHVLHDAEELCDDVMIIRDGQIALQGAIGDIRNTHRKPIIELRIERDAASERWLAAYAKRIGSENGSLPFEGIELGDCSARFTASDVDAARALLFEELAREGVKATRLEIGHTSLEDLFMKVVTS